MHKAIHEANLFYKMNGLIDENCRYQTSEDLLCETGEVSHKETTFTGHHAEHNEHDPEPNPTSPWQELQVWVWRTELKPILQYYNNEPHTIRSMCNWTLCPVSPMEIKGKLLLWTSSQLCAVQYGETGRWSLVGKLIKLPVLPTPFKLFCLEWVGRAKVHIFRINDWPL